MNNRHKQDDGEFTEAELTDMHMALELLRACIVDSASCPMLAAYVARAASCDDLPTLPEDDREAFANDVEKLRVRVWRLKQAAEGK